MSEHKTSLLALSSVSWLDRMSTSIVLLVSSLLDDLKMLVVLTVGPIATPLEASLGEELEAEVIVGEGVLV